MRTIRVDISFQPDTSTTVVVSTEVIVEHDFEGAGREAREAIDAFISGYGAEPE
jgi:hypothetical protein